MIIVIDMSKKLVGFNLFQSFFYKFKKKGTLVFANNPLTTDDQNVNYDELRTHIQDILYDYHASSWSVCLLYDMEEQKNNPISNSITSNIRKIKENIIKPLSQDYDFDKLYYFSLDSIRRNYDGIPMDNNIRFAIDYDAKGYVSKENENEYSRIVFNEEEIASVNYLWDVIRNAHISKDNMSILNPKEASKMFKKELQEIFDEKISLIREEYCNLEWYAKRLEKVYHTVAMNFENTLYKFSNSINSIENPSVLLKQALKMEISSYRERSAIVIHINLNDKNSLFHKEVLKFRHQLEIIALLIYLATNDTKLVFEGGQALDRENHWEVSTVLNDENLAKMLCSYNSKLKTELDRLGKFAHNEIEYEEYAPKTFNLAMEMEKPKLPQTPKIKMFAGNNDEKKFEEFSNDLHNRYVKGIDFANKRIRELTTKLRVQKESVSSGKIKKGNVIEIMAELETMQNDIKGIQQKIAFYKPNEMLTLNPDVKFTYDSIVEKIKELSVKRLPFSTFIKNILLIVGLSLCVYPVMNLVSIPAKSMIAPVLLNAILPAAIYALFQIAYLALLKKRITNYVTLLISSNEDTVNNLYKNDNESALYVQNIYNLIMQKKYVNECNAKVISSNRKFKQFNYHHDKLKSHIEANERLIQILGIDKKKASLIQLDKISSIEDGKTAENTILYCPLNYLLTVDGIKNKAVINGQQTVDIDSNLIGFAEKFVIDYDKEYCHD